ncbi:hypothetical protein BH23ACT2_BH23ACT2_20570 [soil metagenome]
MAQVWAATDQVLARQVAVKILHPHLARDQSFVKRFRGEAVAAARLAHPSIVSIYDTLAEDGINAIVMELVVGTTMRADLDQHGPLKLDAVLAIGTQVADALGAAHASGLVHRDVKPANILLSGDGRVLVADFGIAKAAEGSDLTSDGSMIGTAKYLAPEQVEGGPIDGRTDLYALGVVLYEALTGSPPFTADTDAGTALARLHRDPVPPRQLRPQVPATVELVVTRSLARRPDDRFPDAASMRRALLSAGADPAQAPAVAQAAVRASTDERLAAPAHPPPSPRRPLPPSPAGDPSDPSDGGPLRLAARPKHWPWVLAGLLFLVGVGGGLVALANSGTAAGPGRTIAVAEVATFDPPPGDLVENDGQLGLITDDDTETAWSTERYGSPDLTSEKDGVGLVVALAGSSDLQRIDITTPAGGWTAQMHVVDGEIPTDFEGWGDATAEVAEVEAGTVQVEMDGVAGRAVLIWFTRLAPIEGGRHTATVSAIEVRGR